MRHLKHFETSQKPKNRQSIHEKFLLHKRELNESQREGGEDIKRDKIGENGHHGLKGDICETFTKTKRW